MAGDTIIGVPFDAEGRMRSLLQDVPEAAQPLPEAVNRLFKIRAANSDGQRSSASILVDRMYATRGYQSLTGNKPPETPQRVTLVASDDELTLGTITVGFDSQHGLLVDDLFADQTVRLREAGARVCEFTKLAMDGVVKSKRLLASLFHVAFIYAHRLMGMDNLLIEVNPRHVRYYERMLGFERIGSERLNRRVNAPAVLMNLDFRHAHAQIDRFGGLPELGATERSLYPYFFSVAEEAGIVGRLQRPRADLRPPARELHGRFAQARASAHARRASA